METINRKNPLALSSEELSQYLPEAKRQYEGGRLRRIADYILRGKSFVRMTDEVNALVLAGEDRHRKNERARLAYNNPDEGLFTAAEIREAAGDETPVDQHVSRDPQHQIQPYFDPLDQFEKRHAQPSAPENAIPSSSEENPFALPPHDNDPYA